MSPVIILGLVLMWAVVLIPMWLRRHDEAAESRSVDRFTAAMHTLSRREARDADDRSMVMPHRSRDVEVHVTGASAQRESAQREPAPRYRASAQVRVSAAQRRRRTLLSMLGLAGVFLITAVFTGSTIIWVFEVLVDIAMVAFVVHLRQLAVSAAGSRSRPTASVRQPAPARRVVTEAPAASRQPVSTAERQQQRRWEHQSAGVGGWGEQVVVRRDSARPAEGHREQPRREEPRYADAAYVKPHRAEARYDETRVTAPRTRPEPQTAVFDQTSSYDEPAAAVVDDAAPFDQTVPFEEPAHEPAAAAIEFFDQESFVEPEVAVPVVEEPSRAQHSGPGFIEAGATAGRRDTMAQSARTAEPMPAAEAPIAPIPAVSSTPWEPVPVPPPTYAMKPAAPPRRTRYEPQEPLLPPVEPAEPAAELDETAQLEEILDRRWAVND